MSIEPQFVIRFTGNVSWDGQANGLPKTVYAYLIVNGGDKETINKLIVEHSAAYLRAHALVVQREQGKMIDIRTEVQERMIVPFQWLVSIGVDIIKMTGELSIADEQGTERLSDGSEPKKQ